jgi:hypothetical protein
MIPENLNIYFSITAIIMMSVRRRRVSVSPFSSFPASLLGHILAFVPSTSTQATSRLFREQAKLAREKNTLALFEKFGIAIIPESDAMAKTVQTWVGEETGGSYRSVLLAPKTFQLPKLNEAEVASRAESAAWWDSKRVDPKLGSLCYLVQADEPTIPRFLASIKSAAKEDHAKATWRTLMSQFRVKQGAKTKLKWNSFYYDDGQPRAYTMNTTLEFISPQNGVEFTRKLSSHLFSMEALSPVLQFLELLRKEDLILNAIWTHFGETTEMHEDVHDCFVLSMFGGRVFETHIDSALYVKTTLGWFQIHAYQ